MTELTFKGKEFVCNHHLAVPFRPLVPDGSKGIGPVALDGNLIIHGDNLHSLKALLPLYAGKVDCIFIDPPYNTGNEGWSYNDNVNAPMIKEWLEANPVGIEDGLRHDKWCAMMWPRLRLLHELLSDDGSLWMTLDDNEVHRAREMPDEIFGEGTFIANVIWQKNYSPKNSAQFFSEDHDHLLVIAKNRDLWKPRLLARTEEMEARYSNPDNDPRGPWKSGDLSARNYLDWLKSPEAALTLARAKAFAATAPKKRHLVLAAARFVSQKMLAEQNLPVEFVPLPYALYRIDRS